jgi:transposase
MALAMFVTPRRAAGRLSLDLQPVTKIPSLISLCRPRQTDLREVVNALLYIVSTGCQWRFLPKDFPPFSTVQKYFYRWRDERLLETINHPLLFATRERAGREAQPTVGVIDVALALEARGDVKYGNNVPESAHGTNPATAALAGFDVVPIASEGVLTLAEVEAHMTDEVAALMVTNPNTLGLFDENVLEVIKIVHQV